MRTTTMMMPVKIQCMVDDHQFELIGNPNVLFSNWLEAELDEGTVSVYKNQVPCHGSGEMAHYCDRCTFGKVKLMEIAE